MNEVQKITVEKIYANRNDPKSPNKTLQLRVERDRVGSSNFLNQLLVGGIPNVEKLVAFQTMHLDHITALGVTEGCNLNDKLQQPGKLVVSEITQSEYEALESNKQIPYGKDPKLMGGAGNENMALITEDGEYIRRGVLLVDNTASQTDTYIKHAGTSDYSRDEFDSSSIDEVLSDSLPA